MVIEALELSVILPCFNEEKALGFCLEKIKQIICKNNFTAEIIVVDNGSTDNSSQVAIKNGVRLIYEKERGYGSACLKGFEAARGMYLFLADCDASYDFDEIPRFLTELKNGYDLVIGNRFAGKIEKNAMSWLHRYLGRQIFSKVLRVFFRIKIHDIHCGMRAIRKEVQGKLDLCTKGMEFASEMIIKAHKKNCKIKELPINYYRRIGESKLHTFSDGWRHMRFMLLFNPLFLFFLPGSILFSFGLISMFWLLFGSPEILGLKLYYHPMFLSALLIMVGYQLIIFSFFAKTYAITHLHEESPVINRLYQYITIEKASLFGILMAASGLLIYATIFFHWLKTGFGELSEASISIFALTLIVVGIQTIFFSFMLSILGIKER